MTHAHAVVPVQEDAVFTASWRAWQLRNRIREEAMERKMAVFFGLLPIFAALVWFTTRLT